MSHVLFHRQNLDLKKIEQHKYKTRGLFGGVNKRVQEGNEEVVSMRKVLHIQV
jgi:hypothetical protein